MGFFEPITLEMLRKSAIPLDDDLTDPDWFDEYQGDPGPSATVWVRKPTLFADDRITVNLDWVRISRIRLSLKLQFQTTRSAQLPTLNGTWPWTVVSDSAVSFNDWDPHVLAGHPTDVCRFGVSTNSGHRVTTGTGFRSGHYVFGAGDEGSITSPELRMMTNSSGGGQPGGFAIISLWPPPLEESVDLYFQWPSVGIPEIKCRLQRRSISAARKRLPDQ